MTTDDLAEIRARAEAATDGPWRASLLDGVDHEDGSSSYRGGIYPGTRPGPAPLFITNCIDRRNAEFIAASREDVPWLLSEVERLREAVRADADTRGNFREALDREHERAHKALVARDRLAATVARVRALADAAPPMMTIKGEVPGIVSTSALRAALTTDDLREVAALRKCRAERDRAEATLARVREVLDNPLYARATAFEEVEISPVPLLFAEEVRAALKGDS